MQQNARATRLRAVMGGSIGNLVEWYDWYIYSAFSLYFSRVFFPPGSPTAQLLNSAAIFALGFLMRPLGGWLLGRYADRCGRRAALSLSVLLMCSGSLIIAITPGYGSIGVASPIILFCARLFQGFSLGGEYGASATYLSEVATSRWRGFYSSFQYVSLILGQLLAVAVLVILQFLLLTPAQLEAWGWRIPFIVGAICALVAFYVRRNLIETTDFVQSNHASRDAGGLRMLIRYPREVLLVVGLTMGGTLAFYTYTTYMQKFLVNTTGLSKSASTLVSGATLLIYLALQPVLGALSDKIGRRPLLIAFGVLGTAGTVPILTALSQTHSVWAAIALICAALAIVACYTSISAIIKAELFPAEIRALGVGLPYAVTVSVFGGSAEYVALWFKSIGRESLFYWYVTACITASLVVYLFMRETSRTSQIRY